MTCIAALVDRSGAHIAGDGLMCTDGGERLVTRSPKVARYGRLLVGVSGTWRYAQRLLTWTRAHSGRVSPETLGTGEVGESFRRYVLKDAPPKEADEYDVDALLVVDGRIFVLDCAFGSMEVAEPYYAVGSGSTYALGVLAVTPKEKPRARLRKALEAAARHNVTVGPPWSFARVGAA